MVTADQLISTFTSIALIACAGCTTPQVGNTGNSPMTRRSKDIAAIARVAEDWRAGWLAGDVEAVLCLYDADAPVLMPQGQPAVIGKDAIRLLYEPVMKEFELKSESKLMDVEVSGNWAYFWSTYKLTARRRAGGESFESRGKSVFILKRKTDGTWKISRLMDNSDGELAAE